MNSKPLLILPILLCSVSLSGCNPSLSGFNSILIQDQGVWEANDIYFDELDLCIDNLQIKVTEKIGLDYGVYIDENDTHYNLSIWSNDELIDMRPSFSYDHELMLGWEDDDYLFYFQGNYRQGFMKRYFLMAIRAQDKHSEEANGLNGVYYVSNQWVKDIRFNQIIKERRK